jgi:ribulose-phosphate 3-epimerase
VAVEVGVTVAVAAGAGGVRVGVGVGVGRDPHPARSRATAAAARANKAPLLPITRSCRSAPTCTSALSQPVAAPFWPLPPGRSPSTMTGMATNSLPIKIAPSILSADFARLGEEIAAAEQGGADAIHIDVMDGRFVPNISVGPLAVEAARRVTSLPLHTHLMIEDPARYVNDFVQAGADMVLVHQEGNWTLHRLIESIKDAGAAAGLVLNPATPISTAEEILPFVDLVLIMTVEPGFGGQRFIPTMYDKIARLRAMVARRGQPGLDIEVDGGVNTTTARPLVQAGANVLVAGAAVFSAGVPVAEAIRALRAAATGLPAVAVDNAAD